MAPSEKDTAGVGLEEKVAALRRPETYPHRPLEVEAVETHMAWVFLAGTEAYKLKKPVRYDFLDFSTLEDRRRDCRDEVRLNRRLAPDVYRGVRALRRTPEGDLVLDGEGEGRVVEWLVHMRRLPRERMLDARIRGEGVSNEEVEKVVKRLVRFYRTVPRIPREADEYRESFRREVRECRRELERAPADLSPHRPAGLASELLDFLVEGGSLLDGRIREDRIVEGHGDLRPEHICLEPEPVIIDCLEFNFEFRVIDPADELSFLSVECARLGDEELGDAFLHGYRRLSGDAPSSELLAFYKAFRAFLRAKIAIWHTRDDAIRDHHGKWIERTRTYLELAGDHLPSVRAE
ncbi:MAG: hypothetical protein GWM92_20665 [Gemmatimonadetes bacterium]|nr:hypothetical protein [Gemmatimonadota bacterium]NIR81257.1 hypothetical protein [Gemmatimonadota bacterium]NIT90100.1 hypothetical protein [Gemmatimonadota bacterium]NIU33919.1 hypothetical protein [Gemmatimonadota bacterium]NIU38098.1 hypothetical protein [Gemmatimonadota bacterium]